MRVNPYMRELLGIGISLLNEPPASSAEIAARWLEWGMPLDAPPQPADLPRTLDFLAGWRDLVDAASELHRVEAMNALLTDFASAPSVTNHDGSGWHLHYRADTAGLGETRAAAVSVAAAEHLTQNGMHRLGRCALPECARAFADVSRPGRQRYCSQPCAGRDAVRRHRRRAAAAK